MALDARVHTCTGPTPTHGPRPHTASHPWPAFRCLLISFSPSMIHCMIFWFFSASSEGPGASTLVLFPDSAFLEFLLEVMLAFPLQEQDPGHLLLQLARCWTAGPDPHGYGRVAWKGPSLNVGPLPWLCGHEWGCFGGLYGGKERKEGVRAAWAGWVGAKVAASRAWPPFLTQTLPSETGASDPTMLRGQSSSGQCTQVPAVSVADPDLMTFKGESWLEG